jgi:hypothetical protein
MLAFQFHHAEVDSSSLKTVINRLASSGDSEYYGSPFDLSEDFLLVY